ncbi:putative peptidoglycan bound protein (LPXTG motif) [Lachnospiraceae bacterium TWA4]|nr:putative peptidoglycan bound protein (LPXTG motif) [Lachnospiraceae bacterium TWA4]
METPKPKRGPLKAQGNVPETIHTVDSRADGITLNLFDYWIGSDSSAAAEGSNISYIAENGEDHANYSGINKDGNTNREFRFYSYGTQAKNGVPDTINHWTGNNTPRQNMVQQKLVNGYPVLASGSYSSLDYLFNNTQSNTMGKKIYPDVNHLFKQNSDGYYVYDSDSNYAYYNTASNENPNRDFIVYGGTYNESCEERNKIGFFPFNDYNSVDRCLKNFDNHDNSQPAGTYYNHHFGMTMEAKFQLPTSGQFNNKDITFDYSGDDDMWVFIDDVLVLDVGGIHEPSGGTINFSANNGDGKVSYGHVNSQPTIKALFENAQKTWNYSEVHTIKVFYLERGGCFSNLKMTINMPFVKSGSIEIQKTLEGSTKDLHTNKDFTFNLLVEGTSTNPSEYTAYNGLATKVAVDGTSSSITIVEGCFTLKDGEKLLVEADSIGLNKKYIVKETTIDGSIISKVRETYTKDSETVIIYGQNNQEVSSTPDTPQNRIKNEFINEVRKPMETTTIGVEKQWVGTDETMPPMPINVQLYRECLVSSKHNVTVSVVYQNNNGSVSYGEIRKLETEIADGGMLKFSVDTNDSGSGITGHTVSGTAELSGTPKNAERIAGGFGVLYDLMPRPNTYYQSIEYTLKNIKTDVNVTIYCRTYNPSNNNNASLQQGESTEGTNSAQSESSGIQIFGEPITLSSDNSWKYEWKLPKTDDHGNPYVYYLKESTIQGYEVSYSPSEEFTASDEEESKVYKVNDTQTITITNTKKTLPELEKTSLTVSKTWSDGNNNHGDDSVTVYLTANDKRTGQKVVLNSGNEWKHTFTDLPKTSNDGNDIVYSAEEIQVEGYVSEKTMIPAKSESVTEKKWKPAENYEASKDYVIVYEDNGKKALVDSNGALAAIDIKVNDDGSIKMRQR